MTAASVRRWRAEGGSLRRERPVADDAFGACARACVLRRRNEGLLGLIPVSVGDDGGVNRKRPCRDLPSPIGPVLMIVVGIRAG
jgi:hypothetical protein